MPLLRNGRIDNDEWVAVGDSDPIPADRPVIVPLPRWLDERQALAYRLAPLGVRLRSDQPPSMIDGDLQHFALIALEFPTFTDGRAYSYARLLRERLGYPGELRAVGNVLRDQLMFMARCGFDAFETDLRGGPEAWQAALREIDVWYQPTGDGRQSVIRLRHQTAPLDLAGAER